MKREIKFRAWDGEYMMNVFSVQANGEGVLYKGDIMSSCKLMQFTGLRDKNGVDIYEGDIVKLYEKEYVMKVEWDSYSSKFHLLQVENGKVSTNYDIRNCQYGEVIGNIHQNPELLK